MYAVHKQWCGLGQVRKSMKKITKQSINIYCAAWITSINRNDSNFDVEMIGMQKLSTDATHNLPTARNCCRQDRTNCGICFAEKSICESMARWHEEVNQRLIACKHLPPQMPMLSCLWSRFSMKSPRKRFIRSVTMLSKTILVALCFLQYSRTSTQLVFV